MDLLKRSNSSSSSVSGNQHHQGKSSHPLKPNHHRKHPPPPIPTAISTQQINYINQSQLMNNNNGGSNSALATPPSLSSSGFVLAGQSHNSITSNSITSSPLNTLFQPIPAPLNFADPHNPDSPSHSYQNPLPQQFNSFGPLPPPLPMSMCGSGNANPPGIVTPSRQAKCLSSFLNDMFLNHQNSASGSSSQSPGPGSASLAASTSLAGFSVNSCASSNVTPLQFNPLNGLLNGSPSPSHHQNLAQSAPHRSQWYHGRLDRKGSECRLASSSLVSAYLIRESDRKPGSYVLSFLGRTGINHFRITAICGDYYCGGKQFTSLEELVGFYSGCSDLLKNERLINPVPPPEPVTVDQRKVVAILPYSKMPDTDELSFRKGDLFVVHNEMSDRWLWCTNIRNQESGLVFVDLVETVADDADPNEIYGWFHSRITKDEAFEKLARAGPGSFLVRPSDNSPGDYSIFFHVENSVQRFRVERHGENYVMGGRVFSSLESVVNRYKEEQIVEGHRLLKPVNKAPYETRWSSSRAEELRTKSADIYATIRECREMAQQNMEIKMKGYLFKKSNKTKKWKSFYCVLNSKESMLYFYDNPKRARPKAIIHLSYSALYMVHDSLFDRPFCFQLVERTLPCISTIYYLSSTELDISQEWMQSIRPLCSPNLSAVNSMIFRAAHEDPHFGTAAFTGTEESNNNNNNINNQNNLNGSNGHNGNSNNNNSPKRSQSQCTIANGSKLSTSNVSSGTSSSSGGGGVSQLRSLYVTMIEAHRLPVKFTPHPFVTVSLNTVKVARTSVKCPPDPIWEEDFVLEDIPADVTYFKLTLCNKGKRSKDAELAEINVELSRFQSGEEFEEWLHFTGLSLPLREDWGSVRVRVRFVNELIMPLPEYSPLKDLLLGEDLEVVALCEEFCYHDRLPLANALLKISRYERCECRLIRALIEREIQIETDVSTLFRSNSLTTTLVDQYMKATCQTFLVKSLTEPINKVIDSKTSCELNPAKLDSPTEACSNAENLLNILDEIVEIIFQNACHCPPTVRYICATIKLAVSQKWPNDTLVRTRAVSAFIFLRLICPAILNPRQFNLISEMPSETALRTFILVAKSLQNLANLVEFGTKSIFITPDRFEPPPPPHVKREPWMEVVNPIILKNKSRMIKYIDEIASISNGYLDQSLTLEPDLVIKGQPDRELAVIHSICEIHQLEIQQQAHNRPTLKKLSTVIEMLSAHKNKYLDLVQ